MELFGLYEPPVFMIVYFAVLAFILGMVFGSFLNCAAYRSARNQNFMKGRSICPSCKHELFAKDLIPVLSFVFTKGKCRYCGKKISIRYPLTELFFGVVVLVLFLKDGVSVLFLRDFILACCLFFLSLVDLEIYEIPDKSLIIAVIAWIVCAPFLKVNMAYVIGHLISAFGFFVAFLVISLVMDRMLKKESLGGGDIKLFFVTGLYLGAVSGMFAVLLAAVLGLCFAKGKEKIPFGPAISLATLGMLLFGEPLVQWYLGLIQI